MTNKGLPLLFVSYGGSSLLAACICLGLLASAAWHSNADCLEYPRTLEFNCAGKIALS